MTKFTKKIIPYIFLSVLTIAASWGSSENHGKVTKRHVQTTKKYIQAHFKSHKKWSSVKVKSLIENLIKERNSIKHHRYQTKIAAKIEEDLVGHKKALKSAEKIRKKGKDKYLKFYDQFLIPTLSSILKMIKENRPSKDIRSKVSLFFEGYQVVYSPTIFRNAVSGDHDIRKIAKGIFGFRIPKNSKKRVQANNLLVEKENQTKIESCLNKPSLGNFLSMKDLVKLENCNFDLSTLNPGPSTFWKKKKSHKMHENWFPSKKTPLYFKKI